MIMWHTSLIAGGRLGLALVLAHAADGRAQSVVNVRPLFGMTQMYDTNLFFTPSDRQADFITRVSPGVETEYRSALLTLVGRYTLDAERFADHSELTAMAARQHAAIEFRYRPVARLALAADAELSKTQTPGELNTETALMFGRARARWAAAHASVTRQLDMVTSGTVDYSFTDSRVEGGLEIGTHAATIGTDRHLSLRDIVGVDYRVRHFFFGTSSATSHALILGWTRAITTRASLSIDGGPRVTNGSPAPDLSAAVRYQFKPRNDLSLAYARTQTTIIGLAGTADTQSLTATAAWSLGPSLQMRASPAFYRNVQARLPVDVYHLAVGVARPIASGLSLDVVFDSYVQHGSFGAALGNGRIPRHDVIVRLVTMPASRPR